MYLRGIFIARFGIALHFFYFLGKKRMLKLGSKNIHCNNKAKAGFKKLA